MPNVSAVDRNEYYGFLNNRFEERRLILENYGYRYKALDDYDTAVFVKPRLSNKKRPFTISASFVMCADSFLWSERVSKLDYEFA